jgi:hypothetical protein
MEFSVLGSSGRGGGLDMVEGDVAVVVAEDADVFVAPVSPTEELVAPPPRSQGFGGDGEAISPSRSGSAICHESAQGGQSASPVSGDVKRRLRPLGRLRG